MSNSNSWNPNPAKLVLEENEVHVWRAHLECGEATLHRFEISLASDEKARADRFVHPRDRDSFIAARGILRELLGKYLNRAPAAIEFEYGPQGKPTLKNELSPWGMRFNVSHSHGVAVLAFARGREVGVDVELIRPDFASEKIAERFFSPQEVAELRGLPPAVQEEAFFLCWTRKEAYIKARGEGLQIPLKSFHVSLTPGKPERLEACDSARWTLRSLRLAERHAGALVAEGAGWALRGWEWSSGPSQ